MLVIKMQQRSMLALVLALVMLATTAMSSLTPVSYAADEPFEVGVPAQLILQYVDPAINTYGDGATDIWMWGAGPGNYPEGANTPGPLGHQFEEVNGIWQSEPLNVWTGDNIGYIIRFAGSWGINGSEGPGIDRLEPGDRSLRVNVGDPVTKVRVTKESLEQYTYPSPVTETVLGDIVFKYRDWDSFKTNTQHTVTDVKVTVNGNSYPMTYDSDKDMFIYTLEKPSEGNYSYQFSVGDGAPVNDAYNTNRDSEGKSVLAIGTPSNAASIELSINSLTMEPAEAQRVTAIVKDVDGNVLPDAEVTWSTSADKVARASYGGVITATAAAEEATTRTATIMATSGSAQASVVVTVVPAKPDFIWMTSNRYTLSTSGNTATATVDPYIHDRFGYRLNQVGGAMRNTNFNVSWSSSDSAVATVSMTTTGNNRGRATVSGVAPGTATITVTMTSTVYPDITITQSSDFTVTGTGDSTSGPALTAPVTATVIPNRIGYDQSAVLTLVTDTPENIASAVVDMTNLGAKTYDGHDLMIPIDMINGAISLYVKEGIEAGEKTIPVVITDKAGNVTTITATVSVDPTITTMDFDWDESVIYFMLTDRFKDGDPSNNNAYGLDEWNPDKAESFHGGDLRGVLEKLDYLEELGVNTIWITPIVENTPQMQHKETNQFAYHGYYAKDFTKIDPHLGTVEDLDALLDAAADKGMKIMVDIVLNHSGYHPISQEYTDMIRTSLMSGDHMTPLGDGWIRLPDFKTEDPAVRSQLVQWQADWVNHRTAKGNSIAYFRVDTVKHVENGTWQALKNSAVAINPQFKMIGEDWTSNTVARPYLYSAGMDALLDFDFATRARNFVGSNTNVGGDVVDVHNLLVTRSNQITNYATLGQFLSSHDQPGFLNQYANNSADLKLGKGKMAASLQLTDKGIPMIYYGEEYMNQSSPYAFGTHSNRQAMQWDDYTADQLSMYEHYKKLLSIRKQFSKVFAKGDRSAALTGSNDLKYLVFSRNYEDQSVFVGLNTNMTVVEDVKFSTGKPEGTIMRDLYGNVNYIVDANGDVTISLPSMNDGGTVILTETIDDSDITSVTAAAEALEVGYAADNNAGHVTHKVLLPTTGLEDVAVSWSSDNPEIISTDGTVVRPSAGAEDATVTLTATLTKGVATDTKTFTLIVRSMEVETVPVESINISGKDVITAQGGTLQLTAEVLPEDATNITVIWSVERGTGNASINEAGLLTAVSDGTVTVKATAADGSGIVGTKSIRISGQTTSTPTNPPSHPEPTTPPVVVITDGEKVIAELGNGIKSTSIAVQDIGGRSLQVKAANAVLTVQADALQQWLAAAGNPSGAIVEVTIAPVTAGDIGNAPATGGQARVKVAGVIYDITLKLKHNGQVIDITNVEGGVEITLPYANDADADLLGIYYYNEVSKQWEYVGGSVDATKHTVTVSLEHLSTYAVLEYTKSFTDVPANHWANRTLEVLAAKHIINGTSDTQFTPNGHTTRAEFTSLLVRALGLTNDNAVSSNASSNPSTVPFDDVQAGQWFAKEVAIAYEAGLVTGITESKFAPNAKITREQMAVLLVRAYEYKNSAIAATGQERAELKDGSSISSWAVEAVNKAIAAGLLQGKGNGVFDPASVASRAETAQAILNVLNKL